MTDQVADRDRLWDLIKDIKFAMFTTRHGNGHLHSRPMTTQNAKIDEDDKLWFFMSRSSEPVQDLTREKTVNVVYANPSSDSYVSISGDASVVEDRAIKQRLWSKQTEAWFPKGIDDPDVALVQVSIIHADYWDVKDSKLTQLFKMTKAAITGTPPKLGEHAEIHMR